MGGNVRAALRAAEQMAAEILVPERHDHHLDVGGAAQGWLGCSPSRARIVIELEPKHWLEPGERHELTEASDTTRLVEADERLVRAQLHAIPVRDGWADLTTCSLFCCSSTDVCAALEEMRRVTGSDGWVIASALHPGGAGLWWFPEDADPDHMTGNPPKMMSIDDWRQAAERAGLVERYLVEAPFDSSLFSVPGASSKPAEADSTDDRATARITDDTVLQTDHGISQTSDCTAAHDAASQPDTTQGPEDGRLDGPAVMAFAWQWGSRAGISR
jgi:hypothetical protein